jgi:tetratricopeptide (TPR) repeat protein
MMSTTSPDSIGGRAAGREYSLLLAIVLGVFTIAGAYALLPSTEQKAAALIAEGRSDEARTMLEDSRSDGEFTSYERFMLADLYVGAGDREQAIGLLEPMASDPVHAPSTLNRLMTLYGQAHDAEGQIQTARRLYDLYPTEQIYARLRVLYRLLGEWKVEASFLDRAIAAGHATHADVLRRDHLGIVSPEIMAATAVWRAPAFTLPLFDPG